MTDLPPTPYPFSVYGLKLTKSEPIVDQKGNVLFDDVNRPILLGGSTNENAAKFFMNNVKKNTNGHRWRIWLEK